MPKYNETVDATLESFIYQVKLTDNLMAGLDWNKVKGTAVTSLGILSILDAVDSASSNIVVLLWTIF